MTTTIFLIIAAVALVALTLRTVKIVPQSKEWTVERFGKYVGTLRPGLHLINPVFSKIGHKVSMREQVVDIPQQSVIFKDNATADVDAIVFAQVTDAAKASYQVENLGHAITNLALTNIRSVLGSRTLDEALASRDALNAHILKVMDDATDPWGTKITRVEIKAIEPPQDLVDAMARQMKAEREKRANILDAEGFRKAEVEKAEGEKQAAILKAEGELEAARREAEARERLAEAEAKATRMVAEAIENRGEKAVQYFVAVKYMEALGALAKSGNQKTLLMPMEFAGVAAAVKGVEALLRDGASAPPPAPPPAPKA